MNKYSCSPKCLNGFYNDLTIAILCGNSPKISSCHFGEIPNQLELLDLLNAWTRFAPRHSWRRTKGELRHCWAFSHLPNHYGRDLNACCIPSRPNARRTFDGVVFCRVPLNLQQLTPINIWVAVILSNYKLIFSRIQHHNQIIFAFLGPISSKLEIKVHIGRRKEALPFINKKKGLCNDSSTLISNFPLEDSLRHISMSTTSRMSKHTRAHTHTERIKQYQQIGI